MKASSPNANRLDSLLGAIDMVPEKELEEDADMQSSDFQENVQLINPLNPIKDPVTKRRLKICANRFCGSKGYGNESNWSRRKFGKGQFVWLCKRCSEAYNNDQYCDYCKQIYTDSKYDADIDGLEWIMCESCKKWLHT